MPGGFMPGKGGLFGPPGASRWSIENRTDSIFSRFFPLAGKKKNEKKLPSPTLLTFFLQLTFLFPSPLSPHLQTRSP